MFGLANPDMVVNLSLADAQTRYSELLTGSVLNSTSYSLPNITYVAPKDIWTCSLEDNLNNAASGTGLAFIIFTQAIVEFGPSAPFWSIIFFMMLLSLGMGSEFGTIEGFTASLYDLEPFPVITRRKWLTSGIICGFSCLVGLLFVLGSGSYWVALFDTFSGSFPLITVAMSECFSIGYVYGVDRFCDDIKYMIGSRPHRYWRIVWKFIAPFLVLGLLVSTIIKYFLKPITYSAYDYATAKTVQKGYPWYGTLIAFILVFSSVGCIPVIALLRRFKISNWNYAKQIQTEMHGHTASTVRFVRSDASMDAIEENDSGLELPNGAPPYKDADESEGRIKGEMDEGAVKFTIIQN